MTTQAELESSRKTAIISLLLVTIISIAELSLVAFFLPEIQHLNLICFGFIFTSICIEAYGLWTIVERSSIDGSVYKWLQVALSLLYGIASVVLAVIVFVVTSFCHSGHPVGDYETKCIIDKEEYLKAIMLSVGWIAVAISQVALAAIIFRFESILEGFEKVSQDEEALISRRGNKSVVELKESEGALDQSSDGSHDQERKLLVNEALPQNQNSPAKVVVIGSPHCDSSKTESPVQIERI